MISILIPLFNDDVTTLVSLLIKQLSEAKINFEIICIDDASTDFKLKNNDLKKLKNVVFKSLATNIGRSKIRNLLSKSAKYDWLLFLDADVIPKHNNFIKFYLSCLKSNKAQVYCGGIAYKKENWVSTKSLRYTYGSKREEVPKKTDKKAYRYFFGANFLIHKLVFKTCKFDESITKYGYEDVLFVEKLKENKVKIAQVDNDVYHLGIEDNQVYLEKTKQAIANLYALNLNKTIKGNHLNILKWYKKVETYKLKGAFSLFYTLFGKFLESNLISKNPSLIILDLYKLSYFCYISVKN